MLKKIFLIIYFFLLICLFQNTYATVVSVTTNISTNTTWNSANTYFIEGNVTLLSWTTLTIQPWTVIKFRTGYGLSIWWKLLANWAIFTSFNDNSVWEVVWTGTLVRWSWGQIQFSWVWSNGSELNNSEVRYWWSSWTMWSIYITSNININNSLIRDSNYTWIIIASWNSTIEDTTIRDNNGNWMNISWGNHIIRNTTFSNNVWYWIYKTWWSVSFSWNTISNNGKIMYSDNLDLLKAETVVTWNTIKVAEIEDLWMTWSTWTMISNRWAYDIVAKWAWTLPLWKTLTIEPWTVIKINPSISITINWNLQSKWTSWEKIVFTSYDDNSVWQSLWTWTPAKWSWWYFYITWAWVNGSEFSYNEIRYWWNNSSMWEMYIYNSNIKINNSIISHSKYTSILLWLWSSVIEDTTIRDNNGNWMNISW